MFTIFFDIIIILVSLVMVFIYFPIMARKLKRRSKESNLCKVCRVDLLNFNHPTLTHTLVEKIEREHARGMCDKCHSQQERDQNIDEVFTANVVSKSKKYFNKINDWLISDKRKNLSTILFFTSAGFGLLPIFGIKILVLKMMQTLLLCAGWYILLIKLKKW
jgi:hypothetical protein